MSNTLLSSNFFFLEIKFSSYHHTDNSHGSPLNYLAYMKKGSAKIVSPDSAITVCENDVFFIPQNLSYHSYWHGNDEIEFLSFGFKKLYTDENTSFKLQKVACSKELIEKIKNIPVCKPKIESKTLSLFYDVMGEIISVLEPSFESNAEMLTKSIMETMRKFPHLTIAQIATECKISEPYLYSLFQKNAAFSPNTFRQMLLCEKAIELLLTTNKSAEEISNILEFSSSSYFRKVLKKHTGKTPSEIRKTRGF